MEFRIRLKCCHHGGVADGDGAGGDAEDHFRYKLNPNILAVLGWPLMMLVSQLVAAR